MQVYRKESLKVSISTLSMENAHTLTLEQARELLSPHRAAIMQTLNGRGELVAADLAQHLRIPEKSVYYHLRVLQRSGLIESSEKRQGSTKPQTVFRSLVNPIRLEVDRNDPAFSSLAEKKVKSMLRKLQSDYRRALAVGTPKSPIVIQSSTFRLSSEDRDELQRRMQELVQWANERSSRDAESYSYTSVLLPLKPSASEQH